MVIPSKKDLGKWPLLGAFLILPVRLVVLITNSDLSKKSVHLEGKIFF